MTGIDVGSVSAWSAQRGADAWVRGLAVGRPLLVQAPAPDGGGEAFLIYLAPHVHQVRVDLDDGSGVWRDIVDNPDRTWHGGRLRIDLRDGDLEPDFMGSVTQAAGGLTTEQV